MKKKPSIVEELVEEMVAELVKDMENSYIPAEKREAVAREEVKRAFKDAVYTKAKSFAHSAMMLAKLEAWRWPK